MKQAASVDDVLACTAVVRMRGLWAGGASPPGFLSPGECAAWQGIRVSRRRDQFAAGRLAAKLAGHTVRRQGHLQPLPLQALDIVPDHRGQPWLRVAGEKPQPVSIAHEGLVAVAACTLRVDCVGIDVLLPGQRMARDETVFHSSENAPDDDGLRAAAFAVKEAVLKALGQGLAGPLLEVRSTTDERGARWLALPRSVRDRWVDPVCVWRRAHDHCSCLMLSATHTMS